MGLEDDLAEDGGTASIGTDAVRWIKDNPKMADRLVQLRVQGRTFSQIEAETGFDSAEIAEVVSTYLDENYSAETVAEQRLLQLRRLEQVVGALWSSVMEGDLATEGKQTTNLINTLNSITDLLDVKKDRIKDEIVQLTRAQTDIMHQTLAASRLHVLNGLLEMVAALPEQGSAADAKDAMRVRLESAFSRVFADAAAAGMREATSPSRVQLDGTSYSQRSISS